METEKIKKMIANYAINYILNNDYIGIGSGSTINFLIDELKKISYSIKGAVASSRATAKKLYKNGINVIELNQVYHLPLYIDSADEINENGIMIKGGKGALTREKIIASVSEKIICIAEESKLVKYLGNTCPLPIEVIPMASSSISRKLIKLGGNPNLRLKNGKPFITDNFCFIVDVTGLKIINPIYLEKTINQIPGVVTVGLFAIRKADICLLGLRNNVKKLLF
ncbi:ribose-5-phosphate isomerase RpiA [Candidatus Profftella armatura (Diaphorina cf. continua)]|uniref:Ribose-5-phosphate isomerase A n=1 Tax=Candidatus Profftella armatura (Diaphorina cf. continua) TaxID=2661583 RepID=A0A7R6W065_9PROT|nr:ribose-5-phosphate isomerase RpiA [Candidatus Profftella armatura (Diaphorina cf. continua)]BCG49693.1 ribose-5-phosphate isomerase RpiA [Candidatus Profftella armatura (Diaphorina cf. continua)]